MAPQNPHSSEPLSVKLTTVSASVLLPFPLKYKERDKIYRCTQITALIYLLTLHSVIILSTLLLIYINVNVLYLPTHLKNTSLLLLYINLDALFFTLSFTIVHNERMIE